MKQILCVNLFCNRELRDYVNFHVITSTNNSVEQIFSTMCFHRVYSSLSVIVIIAFGLWTLTV